MKHVRHRTHHHHRRSRGKRWVFLGFVLGLVGATAYMIGFDEYRAAPPQAAAPANRDLRVEPISVDAGVAREPVARPKRQASIGDHRRREDEEMQARRREQGEARKQAQGSGSAPHPLGNPAASPPGSAARPALDAEERQRAEAERRRLTETPLEMTQQTQWGPGK